MQFQLENSLEGLDEKLLKALKWIVEILQRHQISFQVTGGFAARMYGSKRQVNDIDLDIPEDRFQELLEDVRAYIVFGPEREKKSKWDVFLLTLNYEGQEIDIGGAYKTKVFDARSEEWILLSPNLAKTKRVYLGDIEIPVVDPNYLIFYKSFLDGQHQIEDIENIKAWLDKQTKGTRPD